ncbi:MAG: hypothetical protein WAQ33_12545 [Gaiellaceae bacterium]
MPKPAPKPPAPAPHVTTTPHVVHSTPSLTPAVKKVTPKVVRPKQKKVVHHKKARAKPAVVAKVNPKPKPKPKPKPNALPPQVPVGAESAAASSSGSKPGLTSTLIIGILGISMMVFAVAAIPARVVPWRNVAYFIHQRHVDLTLFGIVLLIAAAVAILLSKG